MKSKNVQPLIAVSILTLLTLIASPVSAQNVGDSAPDFTVTDIDGKKFSLSDYRGTVVLLEFFGVDCYYCKVEVAELKAVQKKFEDSVAIISISKDSLEETRAFKEKYGITWRVAYNGWGVFQLYGFQGVPMLIIIDQEGIIRYRHVGFTDAEVISSELEELGLPEFSAAIVLPLFMVTTLVATFLGRKMWLCKRKGFL